MLSREQALIQEIFAPLAASFPGAASLRDDAAVYQAQAGHELVLTVDALIADVHFLSSDDPALIARKALRVNLSDLAAKGARARAYLLTVALSPAQDEAWLRRFAEGLAEDQALFGCVLIGGDTVATPGPFSVTVTAVGEVPVGRSVRRGGARPGDLVYVSGTIGDSALGLQVLRGRLNFSPRDADTLKRRYWLPEPRTVLADALVENATASLDVSDGLIGDLGMMCQASNVSARIEAACVPLSPAARAFVSAHPEAMETCLTGGDDYEILCAVPPGRAPDFEKAAAEAGVPVTAIGHLRQGSMKPSVTCVGIDGKAMAFSRASYSHVSS